MPRPRQACLSLSLTLALALALLGIPVLAQGRALPKDRASGAATINQEDLRKWLTTLASEEFGGRATGTPGYRLAADFMRDHFKSLGLQPGGDKGSFFQVVPWPTTMAVAEKTFLEVRKGSKVILRLDTKHGLGGQAGGDTKASGEAAWLQIENLRDPGVDDLELSGQIAFVTFAGQAARNTRMLQYRSRRLLSQLRQAGVAEIILVDDGLARSYPTLTGRSGPGRRMGRQSSGRSGSPNMLVIKKAELAKIAKAAGLSLDQVDPDEIHVPLPGLSVELSLEVKQGQAPADNVVAVVPGSDEKLKQEYVVIGCHLDHLGRSQGRIRPGADDDGSGSAALIALARAFIQNKVPPRRSIMFLAFSGEERGMIGSGYFSRNPTIELSQIVAELQIDMIGRDEESRREKAEDNKNSLHLVGTKKLSLDLHELCVELNDKRAGFDLEWDAERFFSRSDHYKFARFGVPIAFFFTGLHNDYHRPSDTVDKINFPKYTRIVTYIYDVAFELAQQDKRPLIDPERWEKFRGKASDEPAAPLRKEK